METSKKQIKKELKKTLNLVSKLKTSNIFSKKIPHLKMFIALAVLLLVVFLLFCRRNNQKQKTYNRKLFLLFKSIEFFMIHQLKKLVIEFS
jgi:hypothetical protein